MTKYPLASKLAKDHYQEYCDRPLRPTFDHLKKIAMEYGVSHTKLRDEMVRRGLMEHEKRVKSYNLTDNGYSPNYKSGYVPTNLAIEKNIVMSTQRKGIRWRIKYIAKIIEGMNESERIYDRSEYEV